jgi:hypothetical protein
VKVRTKMRKFQFLSSMLVLSFFSIAKAQSFSSGNNFEAIPVSGNLTIECHGPNGQYMSNAFHCEDLRLSPAETDFFVGPKVDADKVQLVATHADGKKVTKNNPYENGQSKQRFNLWLLSFLQTPLLDEGDNQIAFDITKNGTSVSQGSFTVKVTRGQEKTCPQGYISSGNISDCTSSLLACQGYFQQYNYCF